VKNERPFKFMDNKPLNNNLKRRSYFNNFNHPSNSNLMPLKRKRRNRKFE
jgi:hypothetical protein